MHGVSEAGSVRATQWPRREHAAYMATPLLALDAWLTQKHQQTHSTRLIVARLEGSVCVDSDLSDRNIMKLGIGFTQETAE